MFENDSFKALLFEVWSTGSLLEMQTLRSHPRRTASEFSFEQPPLLCIKASEELL